MALSVDTVWEVRPSVGADTNGAGFHTGASGTDWSQQNSPQYSVTDAVTNGTTTIVSATAAFGTDVVGNVLYIAGGTGSITGAWYEIISRTNATTIVVDRSTGLSVGTGATLKIGGALATIAQAITNLIGGNVVYVKASGTTTLTSTLTLTSTQAGGGNNITSFIGYTTSRSDAGKATITSATNSVDLFTLSGASVNNFLFRNFTFSSTAVTRGNGFQASTGGFATCWQFYNCKFDGLNRGINGPISGSYSFLDLLLVSCEIKSSIDRGVLNGYDGTYVGCYIHDNGANAGVEAVASGGNAVDKYMVFSHCVFYNNTGNGIAAGGGSNVGVVLINCAIVSNTSSGLSSTSAEITLINCVFDSNGGYGYEPQSGSVGTFMLNNAWRNNASGKYHNVAAPIPIGEIILTASPFTNVPTDFTLNNTAGGGAAIKGQGFPGNPTPSAIPGS